MSGLLELQRGFQAYVLGESGAVAERVTGSDAGTPEQRLHIYAEGVKLRFLEVLGEEFPGLHALLGDAGFARLGRTYAAACPSRHPSIRWFGRELPRFLAETPPWDAQPVLAEMARFEWFKSELVDAADSDVVGVGHIAAVPPPLWGEMRPRPVPALRRLDLHFDVPPAWRALDRGEPPPPLTRADTPQAWLLWRKGIAIHWRSIDADEAWALDACAADATFADLCEGLCRWSGEEGAPMRAATLLKQWASDEILRAV